jgi:hypothetical protein
MPIDADRLSDALEKIVSDYRAHRGEFTSLPEQDAAGSIKSQREKAIFLTLGIACDYLRPSEVHWEMMERLWDDHRSFFNPNHFEKADKRPELADALDDYSYFRARKDAEIWATIQKTLALKWDGDPRIILTQNDYNAETVLETMRDGEFPQFGGEKIGPVWVRIMSEEIHPLEGVEQVTFPVDSQTRKVSQYLLTEGLTDDEIREFWAWFCGTYDFEPLVVDQALWSIGSKWDWGQKYLQQKLREHNVSYGEATPDKEYPSLDSFGTANEWLEAVGNHFGLTTEELVNLAQKVQRRSSDS